MSEEMKQRTWQDFALVQNMGIRGFPALLLRQDEQWHLLSQGYQPLDVLDPALRKWLEQQEGDQAQGLYCEVGKPC
jgi:putative protein-disulfide isomerase